jgi:S-adenosylmethionine:tRNA ribosyltransferase-isomerase
VAWNNFGLMHTHTLADFDFDLPPELIAQHPAAQRSGSRLLDGSGASPTHRIFRDLPGLLERGDLLVFNNTQVIKARLLGFKDSGGAVQALVERIWPGCEVWAHVRASKPPQPGSSLRFENNGASFSAEVLGRAGPEQSLFHLKLPADPLLLLQQFGHVHLPPYITHSDTADDERRYQTVFARAPGAVAAPTAALHFDQGVLDGLAAQGVATAAVTLHVGAGTFQPVRSSRLTEHPMHSEWFEVSATTAAAVNRTRAAGGRVVAVGTTSVRALESTAQRSSGGSLQACSGDTTIFITPGFQFQATDLLITNFHLPKSTLMMLVSAFAGHAKVMDLYRLAVQQRYRFFSYGDAMLLAPPQQKPDA